MAVVHRSLVKYFGAPAVVVEVVPVVVAQQQMLFFERGAAWVEHRTYGELHAAVLAACPRGFVCEEPLALFHEVQWRQRGPPTHALHHALEVGEYPLLPLLLAWPMITICVGVHALAPAPRRT
jgi:hypothetical protein